MSVHTRELNAETDGQVSLVQREAEQTEQVSRDEHPLLQMQRRFGNRLVQRAVHLSRRNGSESVSGRSGRSVYLALGRVPQVQRNGGGGKEEQAPENGEAPVEQPPAEQVPEPTQAEPADFELTLGGTLGNPEFWQTMQLVPPLINPLEEGDISPFSLYLLPETPGAETLLAGEEEQPPWLQAPPAQEGAAAEAPSVPSNATLYSVGPLQFRVVFEEPSVELPEAAQESQSRFEEGMAANQPPPGLDTGALVRGLITAFLTETPPGQQILQGVTQVVGPPEQEGGEEGSDVSVNITVDLLPTPLMEGEPPMLIFGLGVTFP